MLDYWELILLSAVTDGVFLSFTLWSIIYLIIRRTNQFHSEHWVEKFDIAALPVLLLALMIQFLIYAIDVVLMIQAGYIYEHLAFYNRALGPYAMSYFLGSNLIPLIFFFIFLKSKNRTNFWIRLLFIVFINLGPISERAIVLITTIHRDYLPSSWSYGPSLEFFLYSGCYALVFVILVAISRRIIKLKNLPS